MMKRLALLLSLLTASCATFNVPSDFMSASSQSPVPTPHKVGAPILTWAGDMAGSTENAQYVASLTGSGGTPGAVTMPAGSFLKLVNAGTGPTAHTGDIRLYNGGPGIVARNAGDTLDANLISFDSSADLNIGQTAGTGVGVVIIQGNSTEMYYGGGASYFDAGPVNFRGSAHSGSFVIDSSTTPSAPLIGPSAANSSLQIQAGGNVLLSLGGATGQGLTLTAAAPTIAATGNTTLTAAQAADPIVKLGTVSLTGNVTVTFPNAQGFWIVDASGITLNAHTLQFISGSTTAAAVTPSTTNQLFFVSTYGSNTISIK